MLTIRPLSWIVVASLFGSCFGSYYLATGDDAISRDSPMPLLDPAGHHHAHFQHRCSHMPIVFHHQSGLFPMKLEVAFDFLTREFVLNRYRTVASQSDMAWLLGRFASVGEADWKHNEATPTRTLTYIRKYWKNGDQHSDTVTSSQFIVHKTVSTFMIHENITLVYEHSGLVSHYQVSWCARVVEGSTEVEMYMGRNLPIHDQIEPAIELDAFRLVDMHVYMMCKLSTDNCQQYTQDTRRSIYDNSTKVPLVVRHDIIHGNEMIFWIGLFLSLVVVLVAVFLYGMRFLRIHPDDVNFRVLCCRKTKENKTDPIEMESLTRNQEEEETEPAV